MKQPKVIVMSTDNMRDITVAILCIVLIFAVGYLVLQRFSCEIQFYNGFCYDKDDGNYTIDYPQEDTKISCLNHSLGVTEAISVMS